MVDEKLLPGPIQLIAVSPHGVRIVSMHVFKDRLFVATEQAVFERGEDGVFRECVFERIPDA